MSTPPPVCALKHCHSKCAPGSWKPFSFWSKHWQRHRHHRAHAQMCPAVHLLGGHSRSWTNYRRMSNHQMTLSTELQPHRFIYLFIYPCIYLVACKSQLPPSWSWMSPGATGGRWARGATAPTAKARHSPPPGASRGRWRRTRWDIRAELDPPPGATPYPELSCVRSPPPPRCLDAARSYSWLPRC